MSTSSQTEIIIFYKYTPVADPAGFVLWMRTLCERIGIFGRILIATEGINGTVEGTSAQIKEYCDALHAQNGAEGTFGDFSDVWFKSSPGTGHAFKKLIVKKRNEIVNTGLKSDQDIDPREITGKHITAEELKQWIDAGEPIEIIDMRNDYEYAVGHFAGSHASGMKNFRDLPAVPTALENLKEKKVVTVCTYGVRCEKASGFLKTKGFNEVYQLHGGIGTYMKAFPGQDFKGSLYVFDDRMTEQFTDKYEVVGTCVLCGERNERFGNCALDECHRQLLICSTCSTTPVWCSESCRSGVVAAS